MCSGSEVSRHGFPSAFLIFSTKTYGIFRENQFKSRKKTKKTLPALENCPV